MGSSYLYSIFIVLVSNVLLARILLSGSIAALLFMSTSGLLGLPRFSISRLFF